MSLKAFHIFFILCSIVLCAGLGVWQWNGFQETKQVLSLTAAVSGFVSAAGLVIYLGWFLKKMKKVGPS